MAVALAALVATVAVLAAFILPFVVVGLVAEGWIVSVSGRVEGYSILPAIATSMLLVAIVGTVLVAARRSDRRD